MAESGAHYHYHRAVGVAVINLGVDVVSRIGSATRLGWAVLVLPSSQVHKERMRGIEVCSGVCNVFIYTATMCRRIWAHIRPVCSPYHSYDHAWTAISRP